MSQTRRLSRKVCLVLFCSCMALTFAQEQQNPSPRLEKDINLLKLLDIIPSEESVDFVHYKTQFHLHNLYTELPHPKTLNLSQRIKEDYLVGLRMLFSVDGDIVRKLQEISQDQTSLKLAVLAVENSLLTGKKIYIYGGGAAGHLAKQMESTYWRPFWKNVQIQEKIWKKILPHLKIPVEEQLIGEITGGDQALISTENGLADFPLLGQLQLQERKIQQGDTVICISASGENPAVIGSIQAALDQWKKAGRYEPENSRKKLFFVYNNPDEQLRSYTRSRSVLDEPGITKINLTTGPQAVAGSTRMQAATIATFVLGHVIQTATERVLRRFLSKKDMSKLGFKQKCLLPARLAEFKKIWEQVRAHIPEIASLTVLETETYASGHFSTYFALKGFQSVFSDCAERSSAFHLYPFDTIERKKRECWTQIWTPAANPKEAWHLLLGRSFQGLDFDFYKQPLTDAIEEPNLRNSMLLRLVEAGKSNQDLYDFSFSSANIKDRSPGTGDLGVAVCLKPEESQLKNQDSDIRRFMRLCWEKGARLALIIISDESQKKLFRLAQKLPGFDIQRKDALVVISIDNSNDPMGINLQVASKIILNAHSTALMTRLGRISGNTMTHATPHNLKLIGRATHLIQSHVNDILTQPAWVKQWGIHKPISYGEANAVLFKSLAFLKQKRRKAGQTAATALSLIRILESLRLRKGISLEEAFTITQNKGLSVYRNDVLSLPR